MKTGIATETSTGPNLQDDPHIVMVDDDALTREWAARRLRKSEINILTLSNGETLQEILCTCSVQVLIVDYRLGNATGLDLIRSMMALEVPLPATCVLCSASWPGQEVASEAQALGMLVMLKEELLEQASLEALLP